MSRSFEQVVSSYPSEVQVVAERARQLLTEVLPGSTETVDPSVSVVSYGYGPGYAGMVCTLLLSKSGVKIGVVRGAELDDPDGLLEGKGKTHKYIALRTPADVSRSSVKRLIQAALSASKRRLSKPRAQE